MQSRTGAPLNPLAAPGRFQLSPMAQFGGFDFSAPGGGPGPGSGPGPGPGPSFPGYGPGFGYSSPYGYGAFGGYTRQSFRCIQQNPALAYEFWNYMQDKRIPARVLYQAAQMLGQLGCYDEAQALSAEAQSRARFRGPPWFRPRQGPPVEYNPWLGTTQPYQIQQQGPYTVFVEPMATVKGVGGGGWGVGSPGTGARAQTGACWPTITGNPGWGGARAQTGACGPSGCPGGVCPI